LAEKFYILYNISPSNNVPSLRCNISKAAIQFEALTRFSLFNFHITWILETVCVHVKL